jgi:hypothetical protein
MALQCPICNKEIAVENINIQEMVAMCKDCNHVFDFKGSVSRRKAKPRQLPLPNRVQVEETDEQLSISYRMTYSGGPMFGFVMSMIGSTLLPLAFITILATKDNVEVVPAMMVFGAILWSWYLFVSFLTTKTHITVNEDALVVKTGPLPLPIKDDKVIPADTITRLYREEVTDPFPSNNVRAELDDGDQLKVVTSLPSEHAMYIARTIDDYLQSSTPNDFVVPGDEFHQDDDLTDADMLADYDQDNQARQNRL